MLNSEGLGFCLAFRRLFLVYYSWMFISFHHFNGFLSTFPYIDYYFCGLGIKHLSHTLSSYFPFLITGFCSFPVSCI